MFRKFILSMILTILVLALAACTTTRDEPTATHIPTAVTPTAAPPTPQPATAVPAIQTFEAQLIQALERRDFAQMQGLIGDTFMLAPWRSQGTAYTPEQAVEQLRNNYLGRDTTLLFDPDKDLLALLDGMDPLSILGPDVVKPSALFVSGWGMDGNDEAILYLAHRADDSLYWYGVLFSFGGFAPATSDEVLETGVEYVMAQQDVQMHAGPDASYAVIGEVFGGQNAQVTGVSVDGAWWRVICPDERDASSPADTVGDCWVSADPGLTQPTTPPEGGSMLPLAIPETGIAIGLPTGHMLVKNAELFRRGSFASYDFVMSQGANYPYLAEIQFFSRESIEGFVSRCAGTEYPCFFGDYPDVVRYDGQEAALARLEDFESFSLQQFNERYFFVSQHPCEGVPCVVREYTTFVGDVKVDVWVMMADESQAAQADALFTRLGLQDDWAGIGAMPGPLYTLLDPGLTLRYPLNWVVREEEGSDQDFVSHSVSFIPPAFVDSDQPQVPAVNLFVYRPPFNGALNEWLEAYSTDAPFGSEAGPETHFFGVQGLVEISGGSLSGLRFTHDVLGLTAHELLFAVGQTLVGLSYVEMGPEDLGPAFVQVQSSLAPANAAPSAEATDVNYVVALQDVAMYRGPAATYQQIGQVMDGQLALVTGVSEDRGWWRVICPNDTIGDCWVSADPAATQPTNRAGGSSWIEYRDARYGYGLAMPCHWIVMPTPLEGDFATLSLRSYDEAFRAANSVKGWWKDDRWPDGAKKIDLTVIEDVPPDRTLVEFVGELLSRNENSTLESLEEITVGAHPALSAVTANSNNPADRHTTLAFRMAPDMVMLASVLPETAWASGDIQGLLSSLAFSPEDVVVMPSFAPDASIIAVPEGCTDRN